MKRLTVSAFLALTLFALALPVAADCAYCANAQTCQGTNELGWLHPPGFCFCELSTGPRGLPKCRNRGRVCYTGLFCGRTPPPNVMIGSEVVFPQTSEVAAGMLVSLLDDDGFELDGSGESAIAVLRRTDAAETVWFVVAEGGVAQVFVYSGSEVEALSMTPLCPVPSADLEEMGNFLDCIVAAPGWTP